MEIEKAADELRVIRQLMERPVRYSTMSGASGILAGLLALIGAAADQMLTARMGLCAYVLVWSGVFCLAAAGNLLLTRLRERRQGMPFWTSVKRRILLTILPPFVAGAALAIAILWPDSGDRHQCQFDLIPAIWMAFYGVALWQAGEFTIREVRVLGACFILAAILVGLFFQQSPHWAMAITFGGFHLVYGTVVWARHGG